MDNILQGVRKGMKVCDQNQNEIGVVEFVKFGDEDPTKPGPETAGVNPSDRDSRDSLIENIVEVFQPDDLPQALRDRLLRLGYVRIDGAGLFSADRYITPDQIKSVSGDKVTLMVNKSELPK